MQEDFRILRAALEEGHPGIYRFTPKPDLDGIFDRAAKQLDRPMTRLAFYRIVAPTVAALKCGHTAARLEQGIGSAPIPPVDVRVLSLKVFVFHDHSERQLNRRADSVHKWRPDFEDTRYDACVGTRRWRFEHRGTIATRA